MTTRLELFEVFVEVDVIDGHGHDLELVQLLVVDLGGGVVEVGHCPLVLGERDDIPDGILLQQDRTEPVDSDRDTSVGRCTESECLYEESELGLDPLVVKTQLAEDCLLEIRIVDTK